MFESAEIGHFIDKETYDQEVPALREALLEAQYDLQQQKRCAVIVLINGIEGAGKGETVKLLNEWMDPRRIEVRTFDRQTDEELARAKAQLVAGQIYKLDSMFAQAMEIGQLESAGIPHEKNKRMIEKLQQVSAEQVQAVAARYFGDDGMTVGVLDPQPLPDGPRKPQAPLGRH